MKLITIVIPSYNVEAYIKKTLDTLLNDEILNKKQVEILVINDGSNDNTAQIALKFQNRYPESLRVINKKNGGHGSTINCGIKEATGKYFKVIDADDWVDSKAFQTFLVKLEKEEADVIFSPYTIVDIEDNTTCVVENTDLRNSKNQDFDSYIKMIQKIFQMHAITYKTSILKSMNKKITEKCFYVDQEYVLYPLKQLKNFSYIDTNVYQYRIGRIDQSINWGKMVQNSNMHTKVLFDLIEDYLDEDLNCQKDWLYRTRIGDLIRVQYHIFLHKKNIIEGYREFRTFKTEISQTINICGTGRVARILNLNSFSFILFAIMCKLGVFD